MTEFVRLLIFGMLLTSLFTSIVDAQTSEPTSNLQQRVQVITPDQITYQPLNPVRGNASPQAGVLWGDIRQNVPSGVLLKFADGFSSPPHIHNITYRAVVISGYIHNDDPDATNMWMGPGSFWMQPAGEVHVTSAKAGSSAMAFLEILRGPYLVQSGEKAFDNGERPINLDQTNVVWLSAGEMTWVAFDPEVNVDSQPKVARLWGGMTRGELSGSFVKLPQGHAGQLNSIGARFRSVVIKGQLDHEVPSISELTKLGPGGYFASPADMEHKISCDTTSECLLYVRTSGQFIVK